MYNVKECQRLVRLFRWEVTAGGGPQLSFPRLPNFSQKYWVSGCTDCDSKNVNELSHQQRWQSWVTNFEQLWDFRSQARSRWRRMDLGLSLECLSMSVYCYGPVGMTETNTILPDSALKLIIYIVAQTRATLKQTLITL